MAEKETKFKFDEKMLEVLACPMDKSNLIYDKKKNKLVCEQEGHEFEIRHGIPILMPIE